MNALATLGPFFALVLAGTLLIAPSLIRLLRRLGVRQFAYEDAPKSHAKKTGTPTLGGLLFWIALLAALLWYHDGLTASLALLGIGCGAIGMVDDLLAIRGGQNRGLRARTKFAATAAIGILFLMVAGAQQDAALANVVVVLGKHTLHVPHWLWFAIGLLAILATTHAVNLTDGLDGLASGTILPPLAVFAWLAWRAEAFGVVFVDVALAAAVLGFLVYNRHPAKLFMGDTGSLALGGVLAGSAILVGSPILLILVGGVFTAETLSVILQVVSFKTTHKRIFRMSPLHHHFELGGWTETKVTRRFWAASALLSVAGVVLVR
jgi:phospho-N-acetylmuramoyl-pentapeptide-transferase